MNRDLQNKVIELARWVGQDPDIKIMAAATCRKFEVATFGVLATENPEAFLELHACAADLREQAPPEERMGFLR